MTRTSSLLPNLPQPTLLLPILGARQDLPEVVLLAVLKVVDTYVNLAHATQPHSIYPICNQWLKSERGCQNTD